MKNSLTIAGKELSGYFVQPVAYVVMTVFLLLGGFFFFALLRYFDVMLTDVRGDAESRRRCSISISTSA